MTTFAPAGSPSVERSKRSSRGTSSAVVSIVLGALFPAYVIGASIMTEGPLGLYSGGDLVVTGWRAVPRLLVLLVFEVPLLVGMWLGVRARRHGARSAGRVGIWLSGVGLLIALWATFLTPLVDAFEEGTPPGFDWRALLVAVAIMALLIRAALRTGTPGQPR